jgi:hypothetical protein
MNATTKKQAILPTATLAVAGSGICGAAQAVPFNKHDWNRPCNADDRPRDKPLRGLAPDRIARR